jgi:hypothetical protein
MRVRPITKGSLTILRFHPWGEGSNLAKIAGRLMNTARNRFRSFLTRGFGPFHFLGLRLGSSSAGSTPQFFSVWRMNSCTILLADTPR